MVQSSSFHSYEAFERDLLPVRHAERRYRRSEQPDRITRQPVDALVARWLRLIEERHTPA